MDYEEINAMLSQGAPDTLAAPGAGTGELSLRERFRRTMFFQDVAVRPNLEFGYWGRTLEVWHEQGLPEEINDEQSAYDYFGIENWFMLNLHPGPMGFQEPEVIEETDEYMTVRDGYGGVERINKHGDRSIPQQLAYAITDRASWEPFKEALDPNHPHRWGMFEESVKQARTTSMPVGVFAGSLAGVPRNLIGFQNIAMMAYEDPGFLTEIIDAFGDSIVKALERALPHVQVDFAMGWEDICFNQGPILPPDFFNAVAGPWYRRIAEVLKNHGCCVYTTDTDGNIMPIVDTFLDNGLNTMFPIEVHGGTDPVVLRAKYGKRVKLWGGVCKMRLAESPAAIDRELERLRPVVEEGGFIPTVDHRVPANVPLDNYKHYLDRKRELFNVGGVPKY